MNTAWPAVAAAHVLIAAGAGTAGEATRLDTPEWLKPLIQSIRAASTPNEARDAFARAAAVDSSSLDLKAAYVRRMVDLDRPEYAFEQA
ncbi:MAG: hypothetical protein ACYS5V_07825, partial [Planctomycetota bacterium]